MDTVTEYKMAKAMAREGAVGLYIKTYQLNSKPMKCQKLKGQKMV